MIKNSKSRVFTLMLYPNEDESHKLALDYIKAHYRYAYIVHDKDIDESTNELKKEHTHCVIQFPNQRYLNAVAKELNIMPNYIEKVSELDSILLYLIHRYETDKHQYSVDEVQGQLKNKLIRLLKNEKVNDVDDAIVQIQSYIDCSSIITISDFVKFTCSQGLFGYYRQSAYIVHRLIDEHNATYKEPDVYHYDFRTGELTPTKESIQ